MSIVFNKDRLKFHVCVVTTRFYHNTITPLLGLITIIAAVFLFKRMVRRHRRGETFIVNANDNAYQNQVLRNVRQIHFKL